MQTLLMKRELTASIVFSSMTAFDMLRSEFFMIWFMVPRLIKGSVSLKRLQEYLYEVSISSLFSYALSKLLSVPT
jgi:hypothetical protein